MYRGSHRRTDARPRPLPRRQRAWLPVPSHRLDLQGRRDRRGDRRHSIGVGRRRRVVAAAAGGEGRGMCFCWGRRVADVVAGIAVVGREADDAAAEEEGRRSRRAVGGGGSGRMCMTVEAVRDVVVGCSPATRNMLVLNFSKVKPRGGSERSCLVPAGEDRRLAEGSLAAGRRGIAAVDGCGRRRRSSLSLTCRFGLFGV